MRRLHCQAFARLRISDPRMIFARTRQTWGERSGHLVPNHHAKNTFLQCGRRWISRPSPAQQPQAPRPLRYYSIQGLDGSGGGASTTLPPAARISFSRAIRVVSKKLPDAAAQVRAIKGVAENQKSECPGGRSRSRRDVLTATTLITCLLGALL